MLDTDTLKQLAFVFNDAAKNTSSALGQSLFSDLASAFLRGAERAYKEDRDAHESIFDAFDEISEAERRGEPTLVEDMCEPFVFGDVPELEEAEERG